MSPVALVGREDELGVLRARLGQARLGSPQVVGVEGQAGIGKTSLLRRFLAETGPGAPVWTSGDPDEADLPWGVLGQLSGAAATAGVPGAGYLAQLVRGLDPEADPLMVGAGLLDLLAADDVVLVIDDAHWADAQSLAAVRFALRRLVSEKVLAVVTYRPEDAGRLGEGWRRLIEDGGAGARLRLGGLDAPDLAKLATAVAGRPLSRHGAARLLEQTAGHPLYARSLLEQVPLTTLERATGPLPVPADLASAVTARCASVSPAARELVAAAAVLGRQCTVADLYALSGVVDRGEALAEAVQAGLLAEVAGTASAEVQFPHVLVRSAIYHDLSPERRRKLHARAVPVTLGRAALGHRIAAATGPDPELAADLARHGRAELAAGRLARGAQELTRAVRLTPPGAARQARLLTAVEALLVSGDVTSAAELAEEPGSLLNGPWADYVSGYLALLSAQPETAETLLTRAWQALAAGAPPDGAPADLPARVASQLAILAIVRLDYPAMLRFGEAAVAAGAAEGWVGAFAWFARLIGLALAGRAGDALALLVRLDAPGGPGGLDGLVARGMIRLWADDLAGAYEDLSTVLRRAEAGEPLRVSQATGFLGEAAFRLGRLDEAVIHTELAVAHATESGRVWDFPILHGLASYPRAARADWPEAAAHVATAAEWAGIMGTRSARAYAALASACLARCRDDPAALEQAARELVASYDSLEPGTHLLGPVLAEALTAQGRTGEAQAALADFRAVAEAAGRRSALMTVRQAEAQLAAATGDWAGARVLFQQAIDAGQQLGMPLAVAVAQLDFGRAAQRSGRRQDAVRQLAAARQACQDLGAAAYAAIASAELAELGMSEPESMPPGTELLTSTEGAVARLVAARMSNQEVAQRLMMSVKTVEYHLTHVYAKLGVTSRRELAGRLGTGPGAVRAR